jgi:hypothetical protein
MATTPKTDPTYGLTINPARPRNQTEQVGVNVNLPFDLHRKLKIKQIQLDLTLTEAITAAVTAWVA